MATRAADKDLENGIKWLWMQLILLQALLKSSITYVNNLKLFNIQAKEFTVCIDNFYKFNLSGNITWRWYADVL